MAVTTRAGKGEPLTHTEIDDNFTAIDSKLSSDYAGSTKIATTSSGIDVTGDVTASGNVGIGTSSPSAKIDIVGSSDDAVNAKVNGALQVRNAASTSRGNAFLSVNNGHALVGGNLRFDDTVTTGTHSGYAKGTNLRGGAGIFLEGTSSNNNHSMIKFLSSADTGDDTWDVVERLRIDSAGNVGVGTSSPEQKIDCNGIVQIKTQTSGTRKLRIKDSVSSQYFDIGVSISASQPSLTFSDGGTERLRIDPAGSVGIGTPVSIDSSTSTTTGGFWLNKGTTAGDDYGTFARSTSYSALYINKTNGDTTNNDMVTFRLQGVTKGHIDYNSGVVRYNTTSDYRLKDAITPMSDSIARLKALKPCNYHFLSDPDVTHDGFIAHEVQEVVSGAVSGTKDAMQTEEYEVTPAVEEVRDNDGSVTTEAIAAVMGEREVPDYQGIDQSKLVPLLVSALQELTAKVEALDVKRKVTVNDAE